MCGVVEGGLVGVYDDEPLPKHWTPPDWRTAQQKWPWSWRQWW